MKRIFIFILFISGCNYLVIKSLSPEVKDNGWRMEGGGIERRNFSRIELQPPCSLLWKHEVSGGFGISAGTAVDDFLFVATLDGKIYLFDIFQGNYRGSYDFGSPIVSSPLLDGSIIYIVLAQGSKNFIAYNLKNGTIIWKIKLNNPLSAPLLLDNRLYLSSGSNLVCINKFDGQILWEYKFQSGKRKKLELTSIASDSIFLYFGSSDGVVYAFNPANQTIAWQFITNGSIVANPSVGNNTVYVSSQDSTLYALDTHNGLIKWKRYLNAPLCVPAVVGERSVYIVTPYREVFCIDQESADIIWKVKFNGVITAPPLLSPNFLFVGCVDKYLYVLDAKNGDFKWKCQLEGRIKTTSLIHNRYLFTFSDDHFVNAFMSFSEFD